MTRRLFKFIFTFVLLILVLAGGVLGWGYAQFTKPGRQVFDQTVVLTKGQGLKEIAAQLAKSGVISNQLVFRVSGRFGGWSRELKYGEFRFPAGTSMHDVVAILLKGITVVRRVTIPEGLSTVRVVKILRLTEGLLGDIEQIPGEGTLFPDTYNFSYGDERVTILQRMAARMDKITAKLWTAREKKLPLATIRDAVILASIVEKETSLREERAHVAGVFINRLRRGMRLQSDPTVVYGLTRGAGPLGRPLRRADLEQDTPFNTYQLPGLPPAPITNPGLAALRAVLHPKAGKDLYFVADGNGGHVFAATFAEHKRNVKRWRHIKAKQDK